MFNNNFLVIGVTPANNETSVPLNTAVEINFATDIVEDTISTSTILMHKVNGPSIAISVTYNHDDKTALVTPTAALEKGTQYQVTLVGGNNGIKTTLGDILPADKLYEFTTTFDLAVSPPKNVDVVVNVNGTLKISWLQPDQYDPALPLTYQVAVSNSALDPIADPASVVWPLHDDFIGEINGTMVYASRVIPPSNYYIYVRAINQTIQSAWTQKQFVINAPAPLPNPSGGGTTSFFEVVENYPAVDQPNISPNSIKILFSDNVDPATITANSVYVIKAILPEKPLTAISFLTDFAPSKAVAGITLDPIVSSTSLVSLTVATAVPPAQTLQDNTEYIIVVRESVKSLTGQSLGTAYYWRFISAYTPFYGSSEWIRTQTQALIGDITDLKLGQFMSKVSQKAIDIVIHQIGYDPKVALTADQLQALDEYATYTTVYDLIIDGYMKLSKGLGKKQTLGDLSVEWSGSLQDMTALINKYKEAIKFWEDQLRGHHNRGYAKPNVAIKGQNIEAYPSYMTRDIFKEVGSL